MVIPWCPCSASCSKAKAAKAMAIEFPDVPGNSKLPEIATPMEPNGARNKGGTKTDLWGWNALPHGPHTL